MKVSEYTAAFDEKYAAADAERKQFLAEGRKKGSRQHQNAVLV